jgi:hypothetical protein
MAAPVRRDANVACRFMGAHTWHTWENSEAWVMAAATSPGCTARSALFAVSVLTVAYT